MKFPYSKARRGQLELIDRIRGVLGSKVFLKAPTGFGKTIVALMSHIHMGKVLYAVRTRNEMSPVIRELRRLGEDFTLIYSAARMCPLNKGGNSHEFWLNCKLLRSRNMCPYYQRLSEVSDDEVLEVLKGEGSTDPHKLVDNIVRRLGVCPFFALSRLVDRVPFIIVTYPYVFRNEVFDTAFDTVGRGDLYLVLDEAHTILNPAMVIDEELDVFTLDKAVKEVKSYRLGSEILGYLQGIMKVFHELRSSMLRRIDKSDILRDPSELFILQDALISLRIAKLRKAISPYELMSSSTALGRVVKFVEYLTQPSFQPYGYVDREGVKVIKVLTPDLKYIRDIVSAFKGALLMSGTLPSEEIIRKVMFSDAIYIDVEKEYGSVFPESNILVAIYAAVTSSYRHRSEEMYSAYRELIKEVAQKLKSGVAFFVYPSYSFMEGVIRELMVEGIRQVAEGYSTTFNDVMQLALKEKKLAVHAVAGGKLTEGLELLDSNGNSLIKVVVIAGVPYPQPDDFIKDLKSRLETSVGREVARKFVMDVQAAVKVAQAIGRAIRSEKDKAFIILADRRFLSRRLRDVLGLKYDIVTSELKEVLKALTEFTCSDAG